MSIEHRLLPLLTTMLEHWQRAACSCGWVGELEPTQRLAMASFRSHQREAVKGA